MKKVLAFALLAFALGAGAQETKKVCMDQKDAKTQKVKQVCKDVKIHKKLEGTQVPPKK